MIAKKYRLSEREVKKVLRKGKPFFSRGSVMNILDNNLDHNRFAIVLSGKSVSSAVCRNFFRRSYYYMVSFFVSRIEGRSKDIVCVVKKQVKLYKNDQKSIAIFKKEIDFLLRKIFTK